jgi:hypothetical protein
VSYLLGNLHLSTRQLGRLDQQSIDISGISSPPDESQNGLNTMSEDAYMLVDQQDPYIFSLLCKTGKGFLDLTRLCLLVHNQEISL